MTPAGGIAIAATVAAVALLALSQLTAPVDNPRLNEAVAIDRAPTYTEPTAEQILLNQPDERLRDYLRRHEDSYPQTGYRTAAFEIDEGLERIEPDGHLATEAGADDVGASDVSERDGTTSQ